MSIKNAVKKAFFVMFFIYFFSLYSVDDSGLQRRSFFRSKSSMIESIKEDQASDSKLLVQDCAEVPEAATIRVIALSLNDVGRRQSVMSRSSAMEEVEILPSNNRHVLMRQSSFSSISPEMKQSLLEALAIGRISRSPTSELNGVDVVCNGDDKSIKSSEQTNPLYSRQGSFNNSLYQDEISERIARIRSRTSSSVTIDKKGDTPIEIKNENILLDTALLDSSQSSQAETRAQRLLYKLKRIFRVSNR